MAIDFPNLPTNGQTVAINGITYKYDSTVGAWLIDSYTSNDYVAPALIQANTARSHANAAFNTANSALPNVSDVSFAGNLTIPGLLTLSSNLNFDSTLSTKIVDPEANVLTIHTNQTERVRFDSTGNVLINRTDSTVGNNVRLDVNGAVNASAILVNGTSSSFPSGTALLFQQTAAPTGWTKVTTHNDKALRVVSGAVGSGGTLAFTSAFSSRSISGTVGSTTLAESQIPAHRHTVVAGLTSTGTYFSNSGATGFFGSSGGTVASYTNYGTSGLPAMGATGGGGSHNHTFTGTNLDMAIQYVDVIIATKD